MAVSDFYCVKCGNKGISIPRPKRQREPGHLKKLYCIYCKEDWNCVEIREDCYNYTYEDFKEEFDAHNFDKEGNRIQPFNKVVHKFVRRRGGNEKWHT